MTVHMMKVAVGSKTPDDLRRWQDRQKGGVSHVTRMWPKRAEEVLAGGSMYWAVAKRFALRQRVIGFEPCTVTGTSKCRIMLDRELIPVRAAPRRPFQGWRYLEPAKAPPDLRAAETRSEAELEETLSALGLL